MAYTCYDRWNILFVELQIRSAKISWNMIWLEPLAELFLNLRGPQFSNLYGEIVAWYDYINLLQGILVLWLQCIVWNLLFI